MELAPPWLPSLRKIEYLLLRFEVASSSDLTHEKVILVLKHVLVRDVEIDELSSRVASLHRRVKEARVSDVMDTEDVRRDPRCLGYCRCALVTCLLRSRFGKLICLELSVDVVDGVLEIDHILEVRQTAVSVLELVHVSHFLEVAVARVTPF